MALYFIMSFVKSEPKRQGAPGPLVDTENAMEIFKTSRKCHHATALRFNNRLWWEWRLTSCNKFDKNKLFEFYMCTDFMLHESNCCCVSCKYQQCLLVIDYCCYDKGLWSLLLTSIVWFDDAKINCPPVKLSLKYKIALNISTENWNFHAVRKLKRKEKKKKKQ